ncbi:MAG: right-handed parallel beta-helix repeat-containing protein, partial [Thermoplasmata archaeon]
MERMGHILAVLLLVLTGYGALLIVVPSPVSAYTPHDPIHIDGNADFTAQAASEGWPGDGSEGNPYIIDGYEINASTNNGIFITETSVYFQIKNVYVRDGEPSYCGIYLINAFNGRISNCLLENNDDGISTMYSANITVDNCIISSSKENDISLIQSQNIILTNNSFESAGITIWGYSKEHYYSHFIDESNTVHGKPVYYWLDREGDTVPLGAGQVILVNCTNVSVENQEISDVYCGIDVTYSSHITLMYNTIYANLEHSIRVLDSCNITLMFNTVTANVEYGMSILDSNNITITNNTITNNKYGIHIEYSRSITVTDNHITSNTRGISLLGSYENHIQGNNFSSEGIYYSSNAGGIELESSNNNTIINNIVSNNNF